jgi:hypothetical protein
MEAVDVSGRWCCYLFGLYIFCEGYEREALQLLAIKTDILAASTKSVTPREMNFRFEIPWRGLLCLHFHLHPFTFTVEFVSVHKLRSRPVIG